MRRRFHPDLLAQWFSTDFAHTGCGELFNTLRQLTARTAAVHCSNNYYHEHRDEHKVREYFNLDKAIASGKSYMVGDTWSTANFKKHFRRSCTPWQRFACLMCWADPSLQINVRTEFPPRDYDIYWRGEYVEIALPHQDHGGERHWIATPPFKSKILVNVD